MSISLALKDDVCRVVVAIDADVGQFKPDARQHHELDPIDLDLAPETRFELLEEEILDDVDAEQLSGIQQQERTHDEEAEQRQHDCARTNLHSTSMDQLKNMSVLDEPAGNPYRASTSFTERSVRRAESSSSRFARLCCRFRRAWFATAFMNNIRRI